MNHIIKGFEGDLSQLMLRCQIILPKLNNLLKWCLNAISLLCHTVVFFINFLNIFSSKKDMIYLPMIIKS